MTPPKNDWTIPMNVTLLQSSDAEAKYRIRAGATMTSHRALAPGLQPMPAHDLVFHRGKTIVDLSYTNFYVGGEPAWKPADVENIDQSLAAAMTDDGLNNVLAQYLPDFPRTDFTPSSVLAGTKPAHFSQGDVEQLVHNMHTRGELQGFDLTRTVFNFMLPVGTVLNDNPSVGAREGKASRRSAQNLDQSADSLNGLGGYHGSIHDDGATIYYAIGVYSELTTKGENGIPAFDQPWKSVVATFYHELCEARTDPDVEDAIRESSDEPLGWTSTEGEEIGDFPIFEANPLALVFQEVPLTSNEKTVPIQLMYSNAVHGPEGPRNTAYPFHRP
jgi:hypothetical protein